MQFVTAPMDGEGVYVKLFKAVGDSVEAEELIAEIESDKATIEVNSPCNGKIMELFVEEEKEMPGEQMGSRHPPDRALFIAIIS